MKSSILTFIASNFISEYENVANSSIAYLLNKYPAAREALKKLIGIDNVPNYFETEVSTRKNGRPDLTGFDEYGRKVIIIEGKFWAKLTDNQPNNYLKEIADNGCILFLAPDKRLHSLRIEINRRISENELDTKIHIHSWTEFLNLIEKENAKHYDEYLSADLLQIKELCQKMDVEGMPPLSASDLDPVNGKLVSNFSDIIDECNFILKNWEHANLKGLKSTPQKYGYGFYFRSYMFGCYLGFDAKKWYMRDTHTPIWLTIFDENWKESYKINKYLSDYDPKNSFHNEIGITLFEGMDKNEVIAHIVEKVKDILGTLAIKIEQEK